MKILCTKSSPCPTKELKQPGDYSTFLQQISQTHTHPRLTILTLVDSSHERTRKKEKEERENTITWVCDSTDRHPETKLEQQDEDCCSAGLEPPHPSHLGVVIHTSQHRNAPRCYKSLPTLASWCSNSHPPASPASKGDNPPTPATRGPRSQVQHSTQNNHHTHTHTRNTNLLQNKTKTRVSCNRCPPPGIRFKIRTQ